MKRTALTVIAGIGMFAAARVASAQAPADRGTQLFNDNKCYRCHSVAGKGNAKGPLDGIGAKLSADEIRRWIVTPAEMTKAAKAKRKPEMKAYPDLPKEDLDALVSYMASLKTK
jgi:mono/diheme cytochrome c family protein